MAPLIKNSSLLGVPVALTLDQFRVDGGDTDARELANARQQQQARASEQAAVQVGSLLLQLLQG